jgi:uncharacterized membrane-anchored protein
LLIASLLGVALVVTYFTSISRVLSFWIAFVLTRPFGATMGDVLTKGSEHGDLDFGTIGSSVVLASVLVGLVSFEISTRRRSCARSRKRSTPPPRPGR